MAIARQTYGADGSYVDKNLKEFSLTQEVIEKLDSIEPGAERNFIQGIKVNGEQQTPDEFRVVNISVPLVEDSLNSTDIRKALSAKQGKILYEYIKSLQSLGRFLSNWNATTGMPTSNPETIPYEYHSGDYYMVSIVGTTNYRPEGTVYSGAASSTVESENIDVSDIYIYDDGEWLLLHNSARAIAIDSALSSSSTNPVENRVITGALNTKQEKVVAGNNIQIAQDGKTISATDTTYTAGNNITIDANNEISATDTTYTAGSNVQISNNNVISATDTVYGAGANIQISAQNIISATDTTYTAQDFDIKDLSDSTDKRTYWDNKQEKIVAGTNVTIGTDGKTINATDTTYTAGQGIDITNGVISNTQTSAEWGNITGTLSDQTDLQTALNAKQNTISDLATIRSGAALGATSLQPNDNISELNNNTGYITLAEVPTIGDATLSIQKNGTTIDTFKANATTDKNINISVPTKTSDITNDSGFITSADIPALDTAMSDSSTAGVQNKVIKSYVDTQIQEATAGAVSDTAYGSSWNGVTGIAPSKNAVYDKISSMDSTISGHTTSISTINGKIPAEASSSNQLADKAYVGDSINSVTAYYITKDANGNQFATKAELSAATTFYSGGEVRVPTKNDYTIVLSDETKDNATTRYIYNNSWEYQYTVNETALTQAQLNALNSGITSGKVSTYDGYATGKQDTLTAGENIKITNNVISANNTFIITEDDVTVSTDDTKGVAPYNTSYGYTNIDISANAGIEWREGAIYTFVVNTEMVVASAYRNVRVRIGSGAYIPVMGTTASLSGSSYFTKTNIRQYQYTTKYEAGGGLHLFTDSNTTYSAMSASEATTGTAASARTISASVLKGAVQTHSPVQSVNGSTGAITGLQTTANLKTSLTDNSDSYYPSQKAVKTAVDAKQAKLVSGTNIKTINGNSILGSGNLAVSGLPTGGTNGQILMIVNGTPTWVTPTAKGFKMISPNSPLSVPYDWYGTESQYQALSSYDNSIEYRTV